MIQESTLDASFNRLSAHFGARVRIQPPARLADLTALEDAVGPLPRDLVMFLVTCNGFRLDVEDTRVFRHIWNVVEMRAHIEAERRLLPKPLTPVRGDASGQRDWIIIDACAARHAILRWDPLTPDARIIASSFDRYFDAFTQFLVARFDEHGAVRPEKADAVFNREFIARRDPHLEKLAADADVKAWLQALELAVGAGGVE